MKLNRFVLLSLVVMVAAGLVSIVGLRARSEAPKTVPTIAKAAKAQEKTAVQEPVKKAGCDADDDDDAKEVKGVKKVDNDDIEDECEDQDDDHERAEKEDGHHDGGKAAVKPAPSAQGAAAAPAKPSKGR
jgi:hypothetical protein